MSTADELAKLVALRDQGVLSDEEFQTEKTRLLGTSSSEGAFESPAGFASPPVPPGPPTGSEAAAGGGGAKKRGGFALTGKQVLIGLVVLAVILAGTVLGIVFTGSSTSAGASEVFLQPTNAQGQNPFTPNVGTDASVPATVSAALKPTSGSTLASYSGNSVGLYGGTMSLASCDIQQMITYLEANPSKASAWAAAEGIPVGQISTYINGLTPMTLRYDTRVTNHGYVNGVANAIPEILQAGQAVLVDSYGVPRARCYCGNPLTPPIALSGSPRYVGPQWSRFSPTTTVVVQQSTTVINNFTLINNSTGQAFSRPVGTAGTSDAPASACTGPSMPGVTACTNSLSPSQSAIQSTVQAFYRGYLASGLSQSQAFLPSAAEQHLLTQTAVQQIETTGTSQQYDLVTCSQQALPGGFSSYVFPAPTVTGSSGAMVVTGMDPSAPSIDIAVGEFAGHWEITSFSCPGITTTTTTVPTSTVPSPSSTSTAVASEFALWSGGWTAHELELEIEPTGTGHLTYADLTLCPSCSEGGAPRGTMDFELTSVTTDAATGAVTASSDPQVYTIGQVVTVSLAAGAPGQLLDLSVGGRSGGIFCNSTSAGQCGA